MIELEPPQTLLALVLLARGAWAISCDAGNLAERAMRPVQRRLEARIRQHEEGRENG